MNSPFAFFKDRIVPLEQANIPITSHILHYGTGCFEGIRAYYSEKEQALMVFRMEDHYKRLMSSGKIIFINLPYSLEQLKSTTIELLKKNFDKTDIYIRPLAFKSSETINLNLAQLEDSLIIYTAKLGRYVDTEKGLKVITSSWQRVSDNTIPPRGKIAGSYVNSCLAKTESALNGYDEALMLDERGHIVEGSAENIFLFKGDKLITSPESDPILVGITRDTIITIAKNELNLEVIERSIDRTEIYGVDEVFLVGTGAEVAPVLEVDKRQIGTGKTGKVTQQIKDLYRKIVLGEIQKYSHWITKVNTT